MTTFGQMVALYINTNVVPLSQCQQTAAAQTAINTTSAQAAATPTSGTSGTATTTDPTIAALIQQGDAAVAQGNAIAAAAQAAMQPAAQ